MSWKKVSNDNTKTWDFEENATMEGTFKEKKESVGANASNVYTFDVKGEEFGVWGSTVLDDQLSTIEPGMKVQITFLGVKPSKTPGRKGYKAFEVYKWIDALE